MSPLVSMIRILIVNINCTSLFFLSHWASSSYFLQVIILSMSTITITIQRFSPAAAFFFLFLFHPCYFIICCRNYYFPLHVHLWSLLRRSTHSHTHGWFLYFSSHDDDDCDFTLHLHLKYNSHKCCTFILPSTCLLFRHHQHILTHNIKNRSIISSTDSCLLDICTNIQLLGISCSSFLFFLHYRHTKYVL